MKSLEKNLMAASSPRPRPLWGLGVFSPSLVTMMRRFSALLLSLVLSLWTNLALLQEPANSIGIDAGTFGATGGMVDCADSGVLVAFAGPKKLGTCPLYHTDVKATVSGYVARVTVKQQFHNPFKEKIEAVYTFPLPEDAAVDEMTMKIGNRVIKGSIKKKAEARATYEAAKAQGHVASLLDQERPNIFNQSVANIEPGQNIDIEIKYVNILKYEDGIFSFVFPTVVGPRFIPGDVSLGKSGAGVARDTEAVPDASKITPPMKPEGERAGHDISIDLNINAGVPIQSVSSKLHAVSIDRPGANLAHIKLKDMDKIPNKDFVANWAVAGNSIQSGYLTHSKNNDGFFTLMLIPPKRVTPETVQPKEMIFLIDCSGSQRGKPIEKAKETMEYILEHMNPKDTFQVVAFNHGSMGSTFSQHSELASTEMKQRAYTFVRNLVAQGGTFMMGPVEQVCNMPIDDNRLRIVTFMTDGYVGNDMQVIDTVKRYRGTSRWFVFGTGNSVNRFLINNVAKEGGGEADYVLLNTSAAEVGKKFYDRISSPVLTDVKVAFEGVEAKETFPRDPADVWAQRPVFITGRYAKAGKGKVTLSGYSGGKPYKQVMNVEFPAIQAANDVLPSIWARAKVDRLMSEDWAGVQFGNMKKEIRDEVEQTALKYHIMSQFTSFVAVEEDRKTAGGDPKQVAVPVETPEGVNGPEVNARSYQQQSGMGFTSTPMLQGATNGTIGPQGGRIGSFQALSGSSIQSLSGSSAGRKSLPPAPQAFGGPLNIPISAPTGQAGGGGWGGSSMGGSVGIAPGLSSGMHSADYSYSSRQDTARQLKGTSRGQAQAGSAFSEAFNGRERGVNFMPNLPSSAANALTMSEKKSEPAPLQKSRFSPSGNPFEGGNEESGKDNKFSEKAAGAYKAKEADSGKNGSDSAGALDDGKSASNQSKFDEALNKLLRSVKTNDAAFKKPVKVQIQLSESPGSDLLDRLNKAGLQVTKREGKLIFGSISLAKLEDISAIVEVLQIKLIAVK